MRPRCRHTGSLEFLRTDPRAEVALERQRTVELFADAYVTPLYRTAAGVWAWNVCQRCSTPDSTSDASADLRQTA